MNKINKNIIGIDQGTTNSCIGVYNNNNVIIIPNEYGNKTTPSYVSFNKNNIYIGETAKQNQQKNPENTIYDSKRLIGRNIDDMKINKLIKY